MLSNTKRITHWITLFAAVTSLFGCAATAPMKSSGSDGNVIIIATLDVASSGGKAVSDNAGALPDAIGRALGLPIGTVAGAVINVASGAVVNAAASEAAETMRPIAIKMISETSCGEWSHVVVKAAVSPLSATLGPGSIARVEQDPATGRMTVVPVTAGAAEPTYLKKTHRCYEAWVAEWKEHQRIVRNRLPWAVHRGNDPLFGGVKLSNIPNPSYDYIR